MEGRKAGSHVGCVERPVDTSEGFTVSCGDGNRTVGTGVGTFEERPVGIELGTTVGRDVGILEGTADGIELGTTVGRDVGILEGTADGIELGISVGNEEGT